ncbi:uncharacterized protein Pyn_29646 [Prunus yedoensis var. nudiflora]|uniref:Glycine-rich protein n=1 Tax=Prunus yedoensis var. nudiflora TaxID=2094558 RepID=A0A314Y6Z9_PRUYE|nr:uncharacterized protein Pyn_29646 [Prunus yedoensis var. nudiflora]
MAATAASDLSDGPVLSLINKRIRALRKKQNRIIQMEEALSQGKVLNKEQEEVLRSKAAVIVLIEELEKLRQPLSVAVTEEHDLAVHRHQVSASTQPLSDDKPQEDDKSNVAQPTESDDRQGASVEELLNLLYFGSLFDVKSQSDFTRIILTRTHERECCLTYDTITDDDTEMLGARDLDLISTLGGLLISRPVDSSLSHKNALQRCIEHAKLWLAKSDQPIEPNASVTYASLRERLSKIMASVYFTTTPEMKAPVEVAAAAAAGNYAPFQVQVQVPVQVEGEVAHFQQKDEDTANFQGNETGDNQSSHTEELQKDELETENPSEVVSVQQEQAKLETEVEYNQRDVEYEQQQFSRRPYQNQRGGRGGGGRRVNTNGRGGRGSGRGGGPYQNGRNQFYDQPGNYYPRNYYNNRGRGGRGGGPSYNHHGSAAQDGHNSADVGVAS